MSMMMIIIIINSPITKNYVLYYLLLLKLLSRFALQTELIPNLSRAENVVHVFEKCFVLYFVVSEDEGHSFAFGACCSVQELEVLHEVGDRVRSEIQ